MDCVALSPRSGLLTVCVYLYLLELKCVLQYEMVVTADLLLLQVSHLTPQSRFLSISVVDIRLKNSKNLKCLHSCRIIQIHKYTSNINRLFTDSKCFLYMLFTVTGLNSTTKQMKYAIRL